MPDSSQADNDISEARADLRHTNSLLWLTTTVCSSVYTNVNMHNTQLQCPKLSAVGLQHTTVEPLIRDPLR